MTWLNFVRLKVAEEPESIGFLVLLPSLHSLAVRVSAFLYFIVALVVSRVGPFLFTFGCLFSGACGFSQAAAELKSWGGRYTEAKER